MHPHRSIILLALVAALLAACGAPSVATAPTGPSAVPAPSRATLASTAPGPPATTAPPLPGAVPSPATAPPSLQDLEKGLKVAVGSYKLFITCTGQGSPAVVLDAGGSSDSGAWNRVQPEVATFTQVCSFDRSSEGRSDLGPIPNTSQQMVTDLRILLANVGIAGPYLLVGHSFGGLTMQLYARLHPTEVAGLVLVDAAHEESYLDPATSPCPQACALINLTESAQQLQAAPPLPDLPLIVVMHGRPLGMPPELEKRWAHWQQDLAARSPQGKLLVAERSGHNIPLLQPELVVEAIRKVSEQVRR